ncbi:hypothetical protein J2R62_17735 [Plesiomonas shigelloides]|uniref:Uncharacterized protein n=1 Tax=Plesiomonas shigelloides TaxID=703 RepID=A0A8I1WBY5_PLESH|nr:hypothetical protein [Plesiomonas shigelloides]MBO1109987.1 hypothetical protein [Plesiomonas shigelloides]
MTVTVNTLDREGNELATSIKQDAHSATDALHVEMAPIEQRIAAILQQNQG